MAANNDAKRFAVYGASGSGKSSFVKQQIARDKRVIVFDVGDEYSELGFKRVDTLQGVKDEMERSFKRFRIAYKPRDGLEKRLLSPFCKFLLMAQQPTKDGEQDLPLTLVVEELSFGFPLGISLEKFSGFATICNMGRHYGITTYGVSQRPAEIATRFRGNLSKVIAFRQSEVGDGEAAAKALGASKSASVEIMKLEQFEYLEGVGGRYEKKKLKRRKS